VPLILSAAKKPEDQLFETMDATDLNKTLKDLMDGLSVKVFRTYNASITLDRLLWEPSNSEVIDAKKADYDRANKEVLHSFALLNSARLHELEACAQSRCISHAHGMCCPVKTVANNLVPVAGCICLECMFRFKRRPFAQPVCLLQETFCSKGHGRHLVQVCVTSANCGCVCVCVCVCA